MTQKPESYGSIPWVPDEEYEKLIGQTRLQLNGLYSCFHGYGHDTFIPEVIEETIRICENFGLRVRGVDRHLNVRVRGEVIR